MYDAGASGAWYLGTPRAITRAADNQVMWRWDNTEPFGNSQPNENPSGQGSFAFNLRFPGQYYDSETGLSQNYFRDYDPAIGRYIESDPIGLNAGANTFAYALGAPLATIDPFGLEPSGAYGPFWSVPSVKYNANPPRTIPVPPDTEKQVECIMKCLRDPNGQCPPLVITGGSEGKPYHQGPGHPQGRAVDFSAASNPDLNGKDPDNIVRCAKSCKFDYGWFENWKSPHWHFQRGPGGNVPPLPTPRNR